jgi:hypothetical protein
VYEESEQSREAGPTTLSDGQAVQPLVSFLPSGHQPSVLGPLSPDTPATAHLPCQSVKSVSNLKSASIPSTSSGQAAKSAVRDGPTVPPASRAALFFALHSALRRAGTPWQAVRLSVSRYERQATSDACGVPPQSFRTNGYANTQPPIANFRIFLHLHRIGAGLLRCGSHLIRVKVSLLRGKVSFLRPEVSLIYGKVSLLRGRVSFLQGKVSLIRGKASFLRGRVGCARRDPGGLGGGSFGFPVGGPQAAVVEAR